MIATFDSSRPGQGPVERMVTASRRVEGGVKGIVSCLDMSSEGILAAGTFGRGVGLYGGWGRGGLVGAFQLPVGEGTGVTQVKWSDGGRYLVVVERGSNGVGLWDVRSLGRGRLAWLEGREGRTNQRLGVDVIRRGNGSGFEVWAGGTDGKIKVWNGVGMSEGVMNPEWELQAHHGESSSGRSGTF